MAKNEKNDANANGVNDVKEAQQAQDAARNAEATGNLGPNNGAGGTATTPVNATANFTTPLADATERGYMGGSDPEERFAEEERARRIRAGLIPGPEAGP